MSNEQQQVEDCESPVQQLLALSEEEEVQPTTTTIERPLHRRSFPICPKCNSSCTKEGGDLVRAFNQVYHYSCFVCEDCQIPVAEKYFPAIGTTKQKQKRQVYCEYHHLKRIGMICPKCDKPLDSTDQTFHLECIQCPSCRTVTPSQYEFKGASYCRFHYSLIQETHCSGCDQAILKQFVEHVNLPNQIWHPECYMIYKFWSVKLNLIHCTNDVTERKVIDNQIKVENKVTRIWTDLSSFEESSANCISDMLLNVAAGAYIEGVRMANQFIMHLQVLFSALDILDQHLKLRREELECRKEAKALCKKMTRFFELVTIPSASAAAKVAAVDHNMIQSGGGGITQELLSLVTGLAQNLKSLIRIGLSAALHLEGDIGIDNAISQFLNQLLELEKKRVWIAGRYWFKDPPPVLIQKATKAGEEDELNCYNCHLIIQDTDCYTYQQHEEQEIIKKQWHPECFICNTCSIGLDEKSAAVLNRTTWLLFCQSCCTTTNDVSQQQAGGVFTHVTLLQKYLVHLKFYLVKLSTHPSSSSSAPSSFRGGVPQKKSSNEIIIMPETKRQRSLLRMMGTSRQKRSDSVHLGQVQRTNVSAAFEQEENKKNLKISTARSSTIEKDAVLSPVSMVTPTTPTSTAKITNSIRRTFSTNSTTSTKRRISSSISGLFGVGGRRAEARRASVLTLDEETGFAKGKTIYLSTLTPMRDFIVRHVAVITIQPLIIPPYSLDELIDLIETKKSSSSQKRRDGKSSTGSTTSALWGRLVTHIKITNNISSKSNMTTDTKESKIFGVPISALVIKEQQEMKKKRQELQQQQQQQQQQQEQQQQEKGVTLRDFTPAIAASFSNNALIPIFVQTCIMAILQSDMSIEGVFRKNGNIRQLKILSETIDTTSAASTDALESLLFSQNSIQLAALLKKYLRELPEPLMTFSLYKLFVRCGGHGQEEGKRRRILHLACCLLPKPNRDTMLLIFCCLKWVATFSETNKMDIPNLARVIAPNVLYDRPKNASSTTATAVADLVRQGAQEEINVIETLIREADQISVVPSDLVLLSLQENVNQDMADLNSRYFINHYIQLLNQKRRMSKSESSIKKEEIPGTVLKSPLHISTSTKIIPTALSTPIPTPTKQRRTSWIPGLGGGNRR